MTTTLYLSAVVILMALQTSWTLPQLTEGNRSRQLVMNSNVPTAATGLNNGNPSGQNSPLQTMSTLHQVTKSGNSPTALLSEMEAQQQEALQMQKQNHQQSMLAAVQTKQDQVATAQAAISNQSQLAGHKSPGAISLTSLNPNAQQLHQQLEAEKQQLLVQQQLLKQQVKPEAQQMTAQQILLTQLLREPASKRPQLLEQIKQTQTKQQAEYLVNPTSTLPGTQSTRSQPHEMERYKTLMQPLGHPVDPTFLSMTGNSVPIITDGSILAAQVHQVQQARLLQRQQLQQMLMLRHQLAMASPFLPPVL